MSTPIGPFHDVESAKRWYEELSDEEFLTLSNYLYVIHQCKQKTAFLTEQIREARLALHELTQDMRSKVDQAANQ